MFDCGVIMGCSRQKIASICYVLLISSGCSWLGLREVDRKQRDLKAAFNTLDTALIGHNIKIINTNKLHMLEGKLVLNLDKVTTHDINVISDDVSRLIECIIKKECSDDECVERLLESWGGIHKSW